MSGPRKVDPRNDPEAAYQAFMSMGQDEWQGLLLSLLGGGVLQPAEQIGFERALLGPDSRDARDRCDCVAQMFDRPMPHVPGCPAGGMTEEQAILTTLSIRYPEDAEHQRATTYKGMTLAQVCAALNHEND